MTVTSTTASSGNWRTAIGSGQGTFRGVAFYVRNEQGQNGGRRIVKREFPLRENGGADDIGKRLREYTFNAILLGEDYFQQRDALIKALDAPGPGELVHPNFGTLQIQIGTWDCKEDTSNGGRAEFSITFYPPLDTSAPVSTADAAAAMQTDSEATRAALGDDFADGWDISNLSLHDIQALMDNATAQINQITASIQQYFGVLDDLSDIMASATAFQASLSALIYEPAALAHQFSQLTGSVTGIASTAGQSFNAYRNMSSAMVFNRDTPAVVTTQDSDGETVPSVAMQPSTPAGTAANNQLSVMVEQTVLTYQAAAASGMLTESLRLSGNTRRERRTELMLSATTDKQAVMLTSRDDARTLTDTMAESLDVATFAASAAGWPHAEAYLRRLRLLFIADMTARARLLPGTYTVTTDTTEPALVLLNRLNGDVTDWDAFVLRNNISNPLFLPAGNTYSLVNYDEQ